MSRKKFLPREHKKRKFLKKRWRRPKGHHSKMRRKEGSQRKMPTVSFKRPENKRGLHPSGFKPVVVSKESEMEKLDKKTNAVYLSGRLGLKKKAELTKKAKKMGIKILNPKEVKKGDKS